MSQALDKFHPYYFSDDRGKRASLASALKEAVEFPLADCLNGGKYAPGQT
ncbi:MAG: hypothetical protein KDD02_19425 [Phaeodactylibacter sp.]|nr:hypothetical protein [Phaeodactylibacter sp.]